MDDKEKRYRYLQLKKKKAESLAQSSPQLTLVEPIEIPEPSAAEKSIAALEGAGQGFTRNFGDEASGFLETVLPPSDVDVASGVGDYFSDFGDRLAKNIENRRQQISDRTSKAPEYAVGGQILATLPGAIATGGSSLAGQAIAGGADAAISSLGASEDKFSEANLKDVAQSAAIGSAVPLAFGAGTRALAKATQAAKPAAGRAAEWLAVRSLGRDKRAVGDLIEKGELDDLGRMLLDEGLVSAGKSEKEIIEGVQQAREVAGKKIGEFLDRPEVSSLTVKSQDVASNLGALAEETGSGYGKGSLGKYMKSYADEEILMKIPGLRLDEAGAIIDQDVPLTELIKMRRGVDESIKDWRGIPEGPSRQAGLRAIRKNLSEMERGTIKSLGDDFADEYSSLNQNFKLKAIADEIASNQEARTITNNIFGLPELMVGLGGAGYGAMQSGDPLKAAGYGLLTAGVGRLARNRGYQALAGGLDTASKALPGISDDAITGLARAAATGSRAITAGVAPEQVQDDPGVVVRSIRSVINNLPESAKSKVGTGALRNQLKPLLIDLDPAMKDQIIKQIQDSDISSTEKAKYIQEIQRAQ